MTGLDAAPREEQAVSEVPVVAAGGGVHLRAPAELPHHHDQGPFEHPAHDQVFQQAGEGRVELRKQLILEGLEVVAVGVPCGVGVGRPGDAGHAGPGLDEPPREQDAVAVDIPAVAIPGPGIFPVDPEGILGRGRGEQVVGACLESAQVAKASMAFQAGREPADFRFKPLARFEPRGVDVRRERQLGHGEVAGAGVFEHEQRVVRSAQPAAEEAGLRWSPGPFGRHVGERDVRNDRPDRRAAEPDDRPDRRVVVGGEPSPQFAPIVPGQAAINGRRVRVVHAVMGRADQGPQMNLARETGEMLGNLDPRQTRSDRLELAPDLDRRVGLHVPHVELAGAAVQEDDDARIGPGRESRAVGHAPASGIGLEQLREGQAQRGAAADLHHLSTRDPRGTLASGSGRRDHDPTPGPRCGSTILQHHKRQRPSRLEPPTTPPPRTWKARALDVRSFAGGVGDDLE